MNRPKTKIINLQKGPEASTRAKELPSAHSETALISWSSRDHIPSDRTIWWYVFIIGGGALILFWSLWTLNFLFAFFTVLAIVALFIAAARQPHISLIEIFPAGIQVENLSLLNFSEVESFWIFPEAKPPLLYLKPRRHIKFPTYLLLENVDPEKVREILLHYIPERSEEFPFAEQVSRWFGF